jgi:beta-glucuronidase
VTPTDPRRPSVLRIGACSLWCAIYVDGQRLVSFNLGGFTPFYLDLPLLPSSQPLPLASGAPTLDGTRQPASFAPSQQQQREIVIVSDNRFDPLNRTVTQHQRYGFYQFGGPLREMTLHELPTARRLQRVQVVPVGDAAQGLVDVTLVLRTTLSPTGAIDPVAAAVVDGDPALHGLRAEFQLTFDRLGPQPGRAQNVSATVGPNGTVVLRNVRVPNPRVWTPTDPQLHTLAVQWLTPAGEPGAGGSALDGMEVRFGLRTVSVQDRRVAINGKKVWLRGFNRHDMHPTYGTSLPLAQLEQDLSLVQKANANWLRGCHYLQDQRWLDLLDERGILFWEEVRRGGPLLKRPNNCACIRHNSQRFRLEEKEGRWQLLVFSAHHFPSCLVPTANSGHGVGQCGG